MKFMPCAKCSKKSKLCDPCDNNKQIIDAAIEKPNALLKKYSALQKRLKVKRKTSVTVSNCWGHLVSEIGWDLNSIVSVKNEKEYDDYCESYGSDDIGFETFLDQYTEGTGMNGMCLDAELREDGSLIITGISRDAEGEIEGYDP